MLTTTPWGPVQSSLEAVFRPISLRTCVRAKEGRSSPGSPASAWRARLVPRPDRTRTRSRQVVGERVGARTRAAAAAESAAAPSRRHSDETAARVEVRSSCDAAAAAGDHLPIERFNRHRDGLRGGAGPASRPISAIAATSTGSSRHAAKSGAAASAPGAGVSTISATTRASSAARPTRWSSSSTTSMRKVASISLLISRRRRARSLRRRSRGARSYAPTVTGGGPRLRADWRCVSASELLHSAVPVLRPSSGTSLTSTESLRCGACCRLSAGPIRRFSSSITSVSSAPASRAGVVRLQPRHHRRRDRQVRNPLRDCHRRVTARRGGHSASAS